MAHLHGTKVQLSRSEAGKLSAVLAFFFQDEVCEEGPVDGSEAWALESLVALQTLFLGNRERMTHSLPIVTVSAFRIHFRPTSNEAARMLVMGLCGWRRCLHGSATVTCKNCISILH